MTGWLLAASALLGFLGVGLGAFGAHALKTRLSPDMLAVFETGVRYQMYHALVLALLSVLALVKPHSTLYVAGGLMAGGTLLFSGSLYVLSTTGLRALGAITPVGGLALLAGWGVLFRAAIHLIRHP